MKNGLGVFRYLSIVGVVFSLAASAAAFAWGGVRTVHLVKALVEDVDRFTAVAVIEVMDSFLIAAALLLFGFGLCDLFLGGLKLPGELSIHNFHELKSRISGVMILVMAVSFIEHFVQWKDGWEVLRYGAALVLVSGALIAFNRWGDPTKKAADDANPDR